MKKILLTGATGFVGSALLARLNPENVVCCGRNQPSCNDVKFYKGEIDQLADFSECLAGVDVVIHLAARVHVMNESSSDPLGAYRETNVLGTLNLARQAKEAGIKRFIYLSTIKVNGESTLSGQAFRFDDLPAPQDYYGQSKAEAEAGLIELTKNSSFEVTIIRPPLVYGAGVKANFRLMMKLASLRIPLPLGAIQNKRSLVSLDNLIDLILTCVEHPKASNQIFLVSDGEDISTSDLVRLMRISIGRRPLLIPVPQKMLEVFARFIGRKNLADRICGNLQVDISHTVSLLNWYPKQSIQEGVKKTIQEANRINV